MNPKTKVFIFGKQVRTAAGRFDSFKAWIYRTTRQTLIITAFVSAGGLLFLFGQLYNSNTISVAFAETTVVEAPAPILDRIADCESGNGKAGSASQTLNGQTLIHINAPGLGYDIGVMQINSSWAATATAMGYDLSKEADNKAFGKWLYANKGTSPWASSQKCWSR